MDLTELGLSQNEEQAFRTLVQHGRLSASQVSRNSGVSYGKIYEVLASLEHKGLVKVIPEKTKVYVPSDPHLLLDLLDEKERKLKALREDVTELKEVYAKNPQDAVVIVRGKHNFWKVVREMKESQVFSYAAKYSFEYRPQSPRKYKEARKRGVQGKVMGRISSDNMESIKKWQKLGQEIRAFPGFDNIAFSVDENQVLLVLIKKNITMLIRDEDFIRMMKVFYENTYEKMQPLPT